MSAVRSEKLASPAPSAIAESATTYVKWARRGRAPNNPVAGWYGLKKGLRGRFGMYVPPLLEALGLAEVEHNAKNNRMRAL